MENLPGDFNWFSYNQLNPDLRDIVDGQSVYYDEEKSKIHYVRHGIFEGRQYKVEVPDDFNWITYNELNTDLRDIVDGESVYYDEEKSKIHYVRHGFFEGRKYKTDVPDDFNWITYNELNTDLRDIVDGQSLYYDEEHSKVHYVRHGIFEGRKYKVDKSKELLYYIKPYTNPSDISMFLSKQIVNNSNNSFLKSDEISQNLPRGKHNSKEKINIDLLESCILIIDFFNAGGGTSVFIESIISRYKKYQTFLICRNFDGQIYFTINDDYELEQSYSDYDAYNFLLKNKKKIEKIFVNHTLKHSYDFLNKLFRLGKEITTITHDFLLLFNDYSMSYNDMDNYIFDETKHSKININKYNQIITQNTSNLYIYNNYIQDKNKIVITPLPDYKNSKYLINTSNSNIVVGIIGGIYNLKGSEQLKQIIECYKNTNVKVVVFGTTNIETIQNYYPYNNIDELNELLITHKPNILIELSICHETYSYTLTLGMITQLPILYLKKNGISVIENRLSEYNKSYEFSSIYELDNLVKSKKQDFFYTIEPVIYFNDFWDNYFVTKKEKKNIISKKNKFDINVYCIYFPQFHEFIENNTFFYNGFTDIINLQVVKENIQFKQIETPNLKEFNLTNITDYNYTNKKSILQKQIDIIYDYNISGFAIYYYWFSINTLTNQNLIMENVINQFFDNSIDMKNKKVFFIWANEPWTNNDAFGISKFYVETDYSKIETFEKIIENLLTYFKNDNYLKIDNKPVISIHQPWWFDSNIVMCYEIFNNKCIENNYSGIHFIVNSINGSYNQFINNHHHFNYKKSSSGFYDENKKQKFLDYKKYINNDIKENNDGIQTLVFDFDNSARLIKPDKLINSTICINNTEFEKQRFFKKIINKYDKQKQSDIENILLINSWNEWGEKMNIEPSEEYGYYYLNLLNNYLSK